jgi:biofilm PGA synthesis protein PgaD
MAVSEDTLHIESPELLSRRRRIADAVITGFMWAVYSYLWAPLVSLIAWLLGFEFAYDVMVRAGGFQILKDILWFYGIMVACIFVIVASWSMINRRRFANDNRRKAIQPVTDADIAEHFGIRFSQLRTLRESRVARVSLNDEAQIKHVESRLLMVAEDSTGPVGPEGAVAENEPGDDRGKNETVMQRSARGY